MPGTNQRERLKMRRFGLSLMLVVVIAVVGAGWAVDRLFAHLGSGGEVAVEVAEQLGYALVPLLDVSDTSGQVKSAANGTSVYDIKLIELNDLVFPAELTETLMSGDAVVLESEQGIFLNFLLQVSQHVLVLQLPVEATAATTLRLLLTITFYLAVAGLLMVWLYPLIKRLQRLASTAKAFGKGELTQRIMTHPRSQLHGIETEFNAMASRIQRLMDDNRLLSSAVSHDLKSPLARLRFGVDALNETLDEATQRDYLQRISMDLTRMEELVGVLLEFARLEQQLDALPRTAVAMNTIIRQAIELCENTHMEYVGLQQECTVLADERYLQMLVNNVVLNAVKFSESTVRITLSMRKGHVVLTVEDDGPGFDSADIERLRKPFQKGAPQIEVGAPDSYGLGLAIVERVIRWQGGHFDMGASDYLGGAKVVVWFGAL